MIKLTRRVMAAGAGALAVVALGAGTTLVTGLPGGSAKADDLTAQQVIKDCDHPQEVSDTSQAYNPYGSSSVPQSVKTPICTFKVTQDEGEAWGPPDTKWADGKEFEVAACTTPNQMGKASAHTTGTSFAVGYAIGVGGEIWDGLEASVESTFEWSMSDDRESSYTENPTINPGQIGHMEVKSALRKFKVDVTAHYYNQDPKEDPKDYSFKDLEVTTPNKDKADAWDPVITDMNEDQWHQHCPHDPWKGPPSPTDSPSGSPTDSPAGPQGTKSLVNVSTGNAADVDGGRSELHSMAVNNSDGQKWNIKPGNDGRAQLEPVIKPGWALGHNTDATKIDQGVQPFALISQDAQRGDQRWRLTGAGGDAYTVTDDTGDCLTDPGKQGGTIGVFACTGGDQQRWRLGGDLPDSREKLPAPATTGNG